MNGLIHKTENRLTDVDTKGERAGGRDKLEFWNSKYTILYIKQTTRFCCMAQGTTVNIL